MSHEINDALKQARENSGLTLTEVHNQTNISSNTMRLYEAGKSSPNHYKIILLCQLYNTTPNDLMGF